MFRAWRALVRAVRERKPRAALLVNYSEFNSHLAPRLRSAGIRVVWYGAPQVWAWRPGRTRSLGRSIDSMALMLPFEEPIWRRAGIDAHYVGHPALESTPLAREAARAVLSMTPYAAGVALLPGSRPHEVRRLLLPMLAGYERVRTDRASIDGRVLLAASLDGATREWVHSTCRARHIGTFEVDPRAGALEVLRAFDAAICASGTASLEAALTHAVPIIVYRVGWATEWTARALLRVPHVALPNILLGRSAFPELLQRNASATKIAEALVDVLDRQKELHAACDEVKTSLGPARTPSVRIANMLSPWLSVATSDPR